MAFGKSPHKFAAWFKITTAGTKDPGRLSQAPALQFFRESGLDDKVLAKVWTLATLSKHHTLTYERFVHAMEYLALAQRGMELSQSALTAARTQGGLLEPDLENKLHKMAPLDPKELPRKALKFTLFGNKANAASSGKPPTTSHPATPKIVQAPSPAPPLNRVMR
ncbi:hypothetical protein WJX72_002849 [[Myrmecia] bisecta]|uniref:EH domain-containing protein n=1 Tax=[Myrmecia] bisecta TaxID=41462 RepID=A0AAW1Q9X7_9CHLO